MIGMKSPRNKKTGIEISHWRVGDADAFQSIDNSEDSDIVPAPPDDCYTELADEQNTTIKPSTSRLPRIDNSLPNIILIAFTFSLFPFSTSHAWYDRTHIAIAKVAGYESWYNAAGADITKTKAGATEEKNHYYNNYKNETVTDKLVMEQISRYDSPSDEEGHLYGAIIAAMRNYHSVKKAGKFAEYHRAFAVHYIGDLSQPLHNVPNDAFNKKHHPYNDGIVDADILNNLGEIEKRMYEIKLRPDNFEEDLAKEIARIANISRQLAFKIIAENRDMTKEEAYVQLGHSASLLKAVLSVP
jgi:hypothetical protein